MKRLFTGLSALTCLAAATLAVAAPAAYVTTPMDTVQQTVNTGIANINAALAPSGSGSVGSAVYIPTIASAVNQLSITPGATGAAANFQASGSPTVTGTQSAAFGVKLTGTASGSGQITFGVAAANGWACQGNDVTTSGVTFRESAFDTTHAAMTVTGSPGAADQYQFLCIAY